MSDRAYNGSIELTKLPQVAIVEKTNKAGEKIRCVLMPIEGNHFTEKEGRVYMDTRVVTREEADKYGQHGFISKGLPSEVYKTLKDDQEALRAAQPILGNIKNFSAPSSGAPAPVVSDDDDLPF